MMLDSPSSGCSPAPIVPQALLLRSVAGQGGDGVLSVRGTAAREHVLNVCECGRGLKKNVNFEAIPIFCLFNSKEFYTIP